ncbi:MAG: acyl-CoA dehydrogenase family protein, partial [Wenzhouxiangellaceae bacterium]
MTAVLSAGAQNEIGQSFSRRKLRLKRTREQFGVTIGHFQALKHQLANMAVEVEPARALYWYAGHAFDHVPA